MWSNRIVNLLNFAPVVHPCYELSLQLICLTWLRPCQNSSLVGGGKCFFPPFLPQSSSLPASDLFQLGSRQENVTVTIGVPQSESENNIFN